MSTPEPTPLRLTLDQLVELQRIDSEHDKAARARARLDAGAAHKSRADQALQESTAAGEKLSLALRSLKDAELEQAGIEEKIKKYEQQMNAGRVTNAREIANVEREIGQLMRQRSALDEKILTFMDEVEIGKTEAAQAAERAREAQRALATQEELYHANMGKLDAELSRLNQERAGASAAVADKALLQRYESLRARPANAGIAVARIEEMHCSACHTQVASQDYDRVRDAQQIATCENCGRILA